MSSSDPVSPLPPVSPDPLVHRQREQQLVRHVERLLDDDRLRVDTVYGARPVVSLLRDVTRTDRGVELKRLMSELGLPDRELQNSMPVGEEVDVVLAQRRWWLFTKVVGRIRVVTVSPTKQLLEGQTPDPMANTDLSRLLAKLPQGSDGIPTTVVVMSTSGFTRDAHAAVDRGAGRTVVLIEPNGAGGWNVHSPTQIKALADLLDPEADEAKRRRVREHVEQNKAELFNAGLAADRLAARLQVMPQLVESELKAYAKANPGLVAKLLDGRMVLFREGMSPAPAAGAASPDSGGPNMPLLDRVKALFARKGDDEKKVAFLAERRAALSQQRDRAYEEMSSLEQQEDALKRQFKEATGTITKKRVTSHLLQLRKDLERRQQLLTVLNQQINVVSTHLHNLELVRQGSVAQLPDTEEMTADAVKAEEMLAELEASNELAASTTVASGLGGLTSEEQALYEELEREAKGLPPEGAGQGTAEAPEVGKPIAAADSPQRERAKAPPPPPVPASGQRESRRGEAEPG